MAGIHSSVEKRVTEVKAGGEGTAVSMEFDPVPSEDGRAQTRRLTEVDAIRPRLRSDRAPTAAEASPRS